MWFDKFFRTDDWRYSQNLSLKRRCNVYASNKTGVTGLSIGNINGADSRQVSKAIPYKKLEKDPTRVDRSEPYTNDE